MRIFAVGFLLCSFAVCAYGTAANPTEQPVQGAVADGPHAEARSNALAAALKWLDGVDAGKYKESWDGTSQQFQARINKEKWASTLEAVRASLGGMVSRKLTRSTYATTLPGAPDGQYVVLRFHTSFTHKKSAIETVTMAFEQQQWKLAGYFIR